MVGNGTTWECVVLDLNTQCDFCDPAGAHPVRNVDQLSATLPRIVEWTKRRRVPVISSMDSHRRNEIHQSALREYCIDGTPGQRKLPYTILATAVAVEVDNTLSVPLDLFGTHQQVIFRKRTPDLFGNPKADRFLTQLAADEFILCGVGLEYSVRTMALGLIGRGRKVTVVYDACGYWTTPDAELALRQLLAKGADVVSVDQLITRCPKVPRCYHDLPAAPGNGRNGQAGTWLLNGGNGKSTRQSD
ncbi:MAG: cysteine hydrolase family protein [Planctomycetes bacterium]|nr:cysteine hydrolase family protein [Planctomycetota bacterium]